MQKCSEAIIIAGGLGTRLQSVVSNLPKCMAPVAGKPFLHYVLNHYIAEGVTQFVLALGYKSEAIIHYTASAFPHIRFQYSVENEPLGTGGAIKKALHVAQTNYPLVLNGDTLYKVKLDTISQFNPNLHPDCILFLKPMQNLSRYGSVQIQDDEKIIGFKEKQIGIAGLINGGVYLLNKTRFLQENLPEKFSFENDYLQPFYPIRNMYGRVQNQYFIDIGIPDDFAKAQSELAT